MNDRVSPTPIGDAAAPGSRFAIVYTVRNEAALLPHAIAFHAAAGCARFYIYWDGTTDDAPALLRDRADVVARDSVRPEDATRLDALRVDLDHWDGDMDVRKRINAVHAATLAAAEGIEWLLSIDPDELVLADPGDAARTDGGVGRLDRMLAGIADDVDQLLVPNVEVLPTGAPVGCPFTDCTLFVARRPVVRAIGKAGRLALLRLLRSRRLAAWFDHGFDRLVSGGNTARTMRDPRTGRVVPRGRYLGYHSYKAFIRTARAGRFDFAVHRWLPSTGGKPRTRRGGLLLHYDLFDADAFAAKFRQRAPRPAAPFATRAVLAAIAQELDDAGVRRFFEREVAVGDAATVTRLLASGAATRITAPAAFFAAQAARGSPAIRSPDRAGSTPDLPGSPPQARQQRGGQPRRERRPRP